MGESVKPQHNLTPDDLFPLHGLNDEQLFLAQRLEQAADRRIREVLNKLGVKCGPDTEWKLVEHRMYLNKITMVHDFDEEHPENGGWYFQKNGQMKILLGHPYFEDGRIKFRERELI